MSGVISLKDIHKVESIGGITVVYYFCTTAVATVIGLSIAHFFRRFFPVLETSSLTYEAPASSSPMDVIALVAGVDRIFDMGRTTLNITGDASCAIIVSNFLRKKK